MRPVFAALLLLSAVSLAQSKANSLDQLASEFWTWRAKFSASFFPPAPAKFPASISPPATVPLATSVATSTIFFLTAKAASESRSAMSPAKALPLRYMARWPSARFANTWPSIRVRRRKCCPC